MRRGGVGGVGALTRHFPPAQLRGPGALPAPSLCTHRCAPSDPTVGSTHLRTSPSLRTHLPRATGPVRLPLRVWRTLPVHPPLRTHLRTAPSLHTHLQRGGPGALAVAGLEHVEDAVLDRELAVLQGLGFGV